MLLDKVKKALRIANDNDAFNDEIQDLIDAGLADLNLLHILPSEEATSDPLIIRAVITYCRCNFGEPNNYNELKRAYDEQKAQLSMAKGYGLTNG